MYKFYIIEKPFPVFQEKSQQEFFVLKLELI